MPTIEVLQLTDLHLMCNAEMTLKGVCTRQTLEDVLQFVRDAEQAGRWDFDHIIITGDIAHDEQLATYEALREMLGEWLPRCRMIPGNHDDRGLIRRVFPEIVPAEPYVTFSFAADGWRLIGLDTHLPGQVAGRIDKEQLDWLAGELRASSSPSTILYMHHPPFHVQSNWLDAINLQEFAAFIGLLGSFPQVRAICTGHVHQQYETRHGEIDLMTTPSTSVQFLPRAETLIVDELPPGFRVFRIDGDTFHSEVVRLPNLN